MWYARVGKHAIIVTLFSAVVGCAPLSVQPSAPSHVPAVTRQVAQTSATVPEILAVPPISLPDESSPPACQATVVSSPLDLSELVGLSYRSNPDVDSALARIQVADAILAQSQAEFQPQISVAQNYSVSDNPVQAFIFQLNQANLSFDQDFNNPPTTDDFHTQLRLQLGLYAGGKRDADERAASLSRTASSHDLQVVRNQLAFRVARAYFRLLQARQLVYVRSDTVDQVERHLESVQARIREETAVKANELAVRVRLAEARESLISAENNLELAWAVVSHVVGVQVSRQPLPEEIPPTLWTEQADEIQLAIASAVATRPEIFSLAMRRSAANTQIRAAQAGKRGKVDLVGDYDLHTGDLSTGNTSFFFGVLASLNLTDGGRTRGAVANAMARLRQLDAQRRRLVLDIELDVRRAWLQLNSAEERLDVSRVAVRHARENLRLMTVQHDAQTATTIELLDAESELTDVRVRYTTAQAEVEIARTDLARAMGRLTPMVLNAPSPPKPASDPASDPFHDPVDRLKSRRRAPISLRSSSST